MTAQVSYLKNALVPHKREVLPVDVDFDAPRTINALAPKDWPTPFVAFMDGQPVLRADWELVLEDGHSLAFIDVHAIPQGGGGGGGSNPMQVVMMVAVLYVAAQTGQYYGGIYGAGFGAAAQAGVLLVGSVLVNSLLPRPQPTTPQMASAMAAASPTYSLQAQGNTARLEAAIPEHFGRMVAFPDFAALPYQEFSGNEQYLFQLLCIGRGQYDIEAIRIEDTPIASFDEITYEVIQPNGTLTLFPANVIQSTEVSGQTLPGVADTYSQSGTTITVTQVAHGLVAGKSVYLNFTSGTAVSGSFTVVTTPTADTYTVTAAASLSTSGNVTATQWIGGFIANASGTTANFIGVDFVLPRGLYSLNVTTGALLNKSLQVEIQARTVDSAGAPTGSFVSLGTPSYTAATVTPQRYSQRYSVSPGRYEVRVRRVDIESTNTSEGHNIVWGGLRAYLNDNRQFGDVTLLAMRLRASNNLSLQASRKVNVIATRKLPIWNGSSWSANTATRSPAWALTYAAKQVGLTDAQLDLAALLTLAGTWATRGDTFDARFDSFLSFWEAISKISGAVRSKPFMQGGVLRVVRDQAATVPVALFSMRNIVRGSFNITYLMPTADTADAVNVGYFDSGTWAPARVQAKLTGSTAAKPVKIEMFGVTSRDQAFREGMYQAASNRYRRRIIQFSTEMEGFIPSFGDLIYVQHDMPAWGQGGEVVGIGASSNDWLYSSDMTNAVWTKSSVTVTPIAGASPSGKNAYQITCSSGTNTFISQPVGYPSGTLLNVQLKAKAGSASLLFIERVDGGETLFGAASFNLSTGVVTNAVGIVGTITALADGWWQISASYTTVAAGGRLGTLYIGAYGSGGVGNYLYLCDPQSKTGAFSTYVETTSAALLNQTILNLSEKVTFGAGTNYIALRKRDGSIDGPYAVTPAALGASVAMPSAPTITPFTGQTEERTHYSFGANNTWRQPARVLSVKPSSLTQVTIEAVNEDDNVHTAETGVTTPTAPTSSLANYTNTPQIAGLSARSMPDAPDKMLLTWQPSPWADYYLVEQSSDSSNWTRIGEPTASNFTAIALYGNNTVIRVAAVGIARGPWVTVNYGQLASYMWSGVDTNLMWNANPATAMWRY